MKEKRRILCRSSFLLTAGEQIKETWRRSIPPSSLSLSSVADNWCSPQIFFLEVMDFSGAGISRRVVYHSISLHACIWVLPRRGEIPWDGKLSGWIINHGSELILNSKQWWGTLNRVGLPADTWIESLKLQFTRRTGDEVLFVFTGAAKSSWKPNWSKSEDCYMDESGKKNE